MAGDPAVPVVLSAVGRLVLAFALRRRYFTGLNARLATSRATLTRGFGHHLVSNTIAVAAGLDVALAVPHDQVTGPPRRAGLAVAVLVFLLVPAPLHRLGAIGDPLLIGFDALVVLGPVFAAPTLGPGGFVPRMDLTTAGTRRYLPVLSATEV